MRILMVGVLLFALAQSSVASASNVSLAITLGGVTLPVAAGGALPLGVGGMAAVTALSLIIGVQLVKRRRK